MRQRSSLGGQLARAEFYAFDSDGKRIGLVNADQVGYSIVQCKETPRHALSGGETDQDSEARREGYRQRVIAQLTPIEREVLRLQGKLVAFIEERIRIPAGDVAEYIGGGYTLIPGSEQTEERAGLPSVSSVIVVGKTQVQVDQLSQIEIAERLGISLRQARRAVQSANRKLGKMGGK